MLRDQRRWNGRLVYLSSFCRRRTNEKLRRDHQKADSSEARHGSPLPERKSGFAQPPVRGRILPVFCPRLVEEEPLV
jgi:hypothetical protein